MHSLRILPAGFTMFQGRDAITFHDPLAAAAVFEPDLCTYRPGTVEVALAHPDKMGRTVLKESPEGRHLVADGVDAEGFFDHYFRVVETFREAFQWAVAQSSAGDVVLLSPGCASYDWFRNFADRGQQFRALVKDYGAKIGEP